MVWVVGEGVLFGFGGVLFAYFYLWGSAALFAKGSVVLGVLDSFGILVGVSVVGHVTLFAYFCSWGSAVLFPKVRIVLEESAVWNLFEMSAILVGNEMILMLHV